MPKVQTGSKPTFQGPAIYEIKIAGDVDISWSERLEGVNISKIQGPDGEVESILVGRLEDQSALVGIVNTLYNLRFPVVYVNCLSSR